MDEPRYSWQRFATQIALLVMRAATAGAKFLLAIYTARYLGLSDLGIYGLLIAGTTIVPAVAGLGMTDWIVRKIVDLPSSEALPLIACRLSLTLSIHLIVQPLAFATDLLLGEPIPARLAMLAGIILLLENLGSETSDLLVARRRLLLSNSLTFLRTGFWPLLVITVWHVDPQLRTLDSLLLGWLAALGLNLIVLLSLLIQNGRWRFMRPHPTLLIVQLRSSWRLYIKDVSATLGIFVDRFLISMFLGLELAGVYTLFWSIGNVVHSLVIVGMLQSQIAPLLAAGRKSDKTEFRVVGRRLWTETAAWTIVLALGTAIAMPLLVPLLGRPLLQANFTVFWMILAATLLRIAADGYGFALLALSRDRAIAVIAGCGALASAAMNAVLTPTAGLWGAAISYAAVSSGLLAIRLALVRLSASAGRRSIATTAAFIDPAPKAR